VQRTISKTLEGFALLLVSVAFVLLCAVSGSGRVVGLVARPISQDILISQLHADI